MTKHEVNEILAGAGREMARVELEKAVATANDSHQLRNHLLVLQAKCIHMMAVFIFNDVKQNGGTLEEGLKRLVASAENEYRHINEVGKMELRKVRDEQNN